MPCKLQQIEKKQKKQQKTTERRENDIYCV